MELAIYIAGVSVAFLAGWLIRPLFGPPKSRKWYIDGKEYRHNIL